MTLVRVPLGIAIVLFSALVLSEAAPEAAIARRDDGPPLAEVLKIKRLGNSQLGAMPLDGRSLIESWLGKRTCVPISVAQVVTLVAHLSAVQREIIVVQILSIAQNQAIHVAALRELAHLAQAAVELELVIHSMENVVQMAITALPETTVSWRDFNFTGSSTVNNSHSANTATYHSSYYTTYHNTYRDYSAYSYSGSLPRLFLYDYMVVLFMVLDIQHHRENHSHTIHIYTNYHDNRCLHSRYQFAQRKRKFQCLLSDIFNSYTSCGNAAILSNTHTNVHTSIHTYKYTCIHFANYNFSDFIS
ncbi:hypothetical protein G7Y89_g9103 [Cudoniella acicularis]|uniref:Uncharacterized protein n=1 Tax=Cudoniella acicularis TaxID=354080 RepID=A0A8H4RJ14_9HELO|nr:hypothetical protein G7Y89_g9103 [Cudoniella acicularis]